MRGEDWVWEGSRGKISVAEDLGVGGGGEDEDEGMGGGEERMKMWECKFRVEGVDCRQEGGGEGAEGVRVLRRHGGRGRRAMGRGKKMRVRGAEVG